MTREEAIGIIKRECYVFNLLNLDRSTMVNTALDIAIKALEQESCEDCISRADALRVAKNEYLRGWHNALCKALSEKYLIHCEEGNFSVIQEETITGLGLSMDCAVGKDVESYMSDLPSVTPARKKEEWIPCSDRLPEERDWYLAVFEEVDTGFIGLPYIADYLMGTHTIYTTEDGWIIRNCTDIEGGASEYYKKLRCVAWKPLPEPFKAETEGAE